MIKLENTDIYGWEAATRGMRNPLNSWDKSDSGWKDNETEIANSDGIRWNTWTWQVGPNDLELMKRLRKAGSDHRKYLRMIMVTVDITAPLYWWKEFDTYKVGTVANSCSTMHTIHKKKFEFSDFSAEHMTPSAIECLDFTLRTLNYYREAYLQTKDKCMWYQMIQLLPASYNQRRTVQMSYENLIAMYYARKDHKLDEWHIFCDWIKTLPYANDLIVAEGK